MPTAKEMIAAKTGDRVHRFNCEFIPAWVGNKDPAIIAINRYGISPVMKRCLSLYFFTEEYHED